MISVTLQRRMGRHWRAGSGSSRAAVEPLQLLHSTFLWIVFYSESSDLFSRISACRHAATDSDMAAQFPVCDPLDEYGPKRAAEAIANHTLIVPSFLGLPSQATGNLKSNHPPNYFPSAFIPEPAQTTSMSINSSFGMLQLAFDDDFF